MHLDLFRKKEKDFPEIPHKENISSLRIANCKYSTLSRLAEFKNLVELDVAGFPDKSFEMLTHLKKIRYIMISNPPLVSDLSDLGAITSIESLSLKTLPSWDVSGKVLTITSLEPLAKLSQLQHLELFGVVPEDRSLTPLRECKNLKTLRVSKYPASEVEEFYSSTGVENRHNPRPSFDS